MAVSVSAYDLKGNETEEKKVSEDFVLPDIINPKEAEELGIKSRAYDKESNLYTFVFDNNDGTSTMKVFNHPVKYYDENGDIKDISLRLTETKNGSYKTADNSIITTFPQKLSDGIDLVYDEVNVSMKPLVDDNIIAECDDTLRKVSYQADENTSYEYQLTYSGYKEDIVVKQYTGQTEYDFILYTNGLTLREDEGTLRLLDSKGVSAAEIGDIIIYSADHKNNTLGSITYETVKESEEYTLQVHISDDYLRDENTLYPIKIDPYIYVNYAASGIDGINDSTICSNYNSYDNETNYLYVGKRTVKGKSRALMGFHNLDLSPIHSSSNVTGAYVELSDVLQQNDSMTVMCKMFNGSWTPSTVTWSNVNPAGNSYTLLSSKEISYSNGISQTTAHRYKFNIKTAVMRWVDAKDIPASYEAFRPNRGLIFHTTYGVENGDTEQYKKFAAYTGTSQSPSLTILFSYTINRNEFFTKYDPVKYNTSYALNNNPTDLYRYRANCYGYAMGLLYHDKATIAENSYTKQIPGQFYYEELYHTYNESTEASLINSIRANVIRDAQTISSETDCDYSVTDYNLPSGTTTIPQLGVESRLIAMLVYVEDNGTGYYNNDFHFYIQNSDGTWSHKSGFKNVSNCSFPNSLNNSKILTNDNLLTYAFKDKYSNSTMLKFFEVTKRHSPLPYLYNTPYDFFEIDVGDYLDNPNIIDNSISNSVANIDFANDVDVYYLQNTTNKQYRIRAFEDPDFAVNFDMTLKLCSSTGTVLATYSDETPIDFYYNLSGGNQYYIIIYNHAIDNTVYNAETPLEYFLSIT